METEIGIEQLKDLLREKEAEIERMKPIVDEYDQLKNHEINEAKKKVGSRWHDGYSILPVYAIKDLVNMLE